MQELKISEFSFHEFLVEFQQAVQDGYKLDLASNDRFPQRYGSHLEVTLVKVSEEVVTEVTPEDIPVVASKEEAEAILAQVVSEVKQQEEVTKVVKAGRPRKE